MNTQNEKENEHTPRAINPDEVGFEPSANKIKSQEKIEIKESGLGRDFSNYQQDEHIENTISQVDAETIKLQEDLKDDSINGDKDEINEDDNRDRKDSTEDWDAENSRTGRHR